MFTPERILQEVRPRLRGLCDSRWLWLQQPDLVQAKQDLSVLTGAVSEKEDVGARVVVVARGDPEARAMMAWLVCGEKTPALTDLDWEILEWRRACIDHGADLLDRSSSPSKRHSLRPADAAALLAFRYLRESGPLSSAWGLLEPTLRGSIGRRTLQKWITAPAPETAPADADLALAVALGLLDNVRKQENLTPRQHQHAQNAFQKAYLETDTAPVHLLKPQATGDAGDDDAAPAFSSIFSSGVAAIYNKQPERLA